MKLILRLLLSAIAVYTTAYLLPGVTLDGISATIVTTVVLAIANATLKPILKILTLPINILTLGLFSLVINAIIVMLVAYLVPGFTVPTFLDALIFSIVLSLISGVLGWIF